MDARTARIESLIRQLQAALPGLAVRAGSTTVDFTASDVSGTTTVQHGLGREPIAVFAQALGSVNYHAQPLSADDADLAVQARTLNGTSPTVTLTVSWVAIG